MKLTDLEPRWLSPHMFAFRCPHCRQTWLTCKSAPMDYAAQMALARASDLDPTGPRYGAVLTREETAWTFNGSDFATMTVEPSVDASNSGHWHGHITAGKIR